jgi:inositol transport system substrate-binding protein
MFSRSPGQRPWQYAVAAAIGVLLLATAACNRSQPAASGTTPGEKPLVIGASVMNLSSEFIAMITQAMEAKAREMGVRLIVNDAQRSPERQVQQVESFIAQKVDAIIINPCEVEASSPGVDKAVAAGIPIVSVNSETRSKPTAFIGSRDEESARLAMEFIATRLTGKGNVLIMQGFLGQAAQIRRDQGARDVLARYPGITVLAEQTAEWDRAKAMTLMENWIQAHGSKINAVFAHNDEMGLGAVLALQRAKMKNGVVVVSVDAIADALHAVKEGLLDATVFQDSVGQGSTAVETAVKIARKEPFAAEVFIPFQLVTRDNVAQYLGRQNRN